MRKGDIDKVESFTLHESSEGARAGTTVASRRINKHPYGSKQTTLASPHLTFLHHLMFQTPLQPQDGHPSAWHGHSSQNGSHGSVGIPRIS
jgi:hypothetical protein